MPASMVAGFLLTRMTGTPGRAVHDLLHDGSELRCIAALVGHGNGVDPELLAHAVDLGGLDRLDLLGCCIAGLGGLDRNGKHVRD